MLQNNVNRSQLASTSIRIPIAETYNKSYSTATNQLTGKISYDPKPWLYLSILGAWLLSLLWFQPRLWQLLDIAYSWPSWLALFSFIIFIDFAWLYGFYNIGVVIFAFIYHKTAAKPERALTKTTLLEYPAVAILYTTYNDFVEESVRSCVEQDYPNFTVYLLDDSTRQEYKDKVDAFAAKYPNQTVVVRRTDRIAFKAGNLNHGLANFATKEPYFAIADADEILPPDFLTKLVPVMEADDRCGFVQANHRANPERKSGLAESLGVGIDIHWKWYQPLRNDYGFVMFLGHGALLRRKCWEEVDGFPDIVSEDLGFAIDIREKGYRGRFVEDVICYEDFPDTVRAFRIRHMKWTRGTSEFLKKKASWLLKAKNITWIEKMDILFPTLNLPLTLVYFLFMINANLLLPYFFGQQESVNLGFLGIDLMLPVIVLSEQFSTIYSIDFFLITLLTFFAPVLCFMVALASTPAKLFRFLSHSTALYAALGPLSSIGVLTYMISGKAVFLVTGDIEQKEHLQKGKTTNVRQGIKDAWQNFIHKSHPDNLSVQLFELMTGLVFAVACLYMFQVSFFGLCLAFMLLPFMHHLGWNNPIVEKLVYLPFILIILGVAMAGFSLTGMQTIFFSYGFHM